MHKTMVYLPEGLHKNLKRLAVERDTSVADLIREATMALLEEEKEDLAAAGRALAEFKRDPASGMDLESYHRKRSHR